MPYHFSRPYATGSGSDILVPIRKRGSQDFALGTDWSPAAGDVKVALDGGAAANITTLPVAVVRGLTAAWKFVFSNAELTARYIEVSIADAATKAVEDEFIIVETVPPSIGVVQSGSTTHVQLAASAPAIDGVYVGMVIYFLTGPPAREALGITAYNGSTRQCTLDGVLSAAPDVTTRYSILRGD